MSSTPPHRSSPPHGAPARPTPEPAVLAQSVSRRYGRGAGAVDALVDVSLAVAPGELVAITGPSGCGKSTLLNLVGGVDRPDTGSIRVCGIDLHEASETELVRLRRRHVGVVFQAFHLVPHLTVEENVALPLALAGRRNPERVAQLIARVGLTHRARHYPGELSGGEQQRTAVARAMVHAPGVLLADEPTGNLDSANGADVIRLLDDLRRDHSTALLLVTHDEALATIADRVVRLRDGHVEATL